VYIHRRAKCFQKTRFRSRNGYDRIVFTTAARETCSMGWLRLVGSLKL